MDEQSPPRTCCNDLQLDQLILDELPAAEGTALRAHLSSSPTCMTRFDALRADHDAWQKSMPPLPMVVESSDADSSGPNNVVVLADRRRAVVRVASGLAVTLAAAAAILVVVAPVADPLDDVVRHKGGGVSASFAVEGDGHKDLFDGDTVALPARLRADLRLTGEGVVGLEARTSMAWQPLLTPQPASSTATLRATLPAAASAVRVVACATAAQVQAIDRRSDVVGEGCAVDGITVVVAQ